MGGRFGWAHVQYGDWLGTVALDNPDDRSDLYRLVGIDSDEWKICGLEIESASEIAGGVIGSVLAVRRELIGEHADWEKTARAHGGAIPTTRFYFREGLAMAVLGEFKRFDMRATLHAIEVPGLGLEVVDTIYPSESE